MLPLNAKGSTFELISWIGLVIVALIIGYWFFSHFSLGKGSVEQIQNDLKNIRIMVDDACETKSYKASYNPFIEEGTLEIMDGNICISSNKMRLCRTVLCEKLSAEDKNIDLLQTKEIEVIKETNSDIVEIRKAGE